MSTPITPEALMQSLGLTFKNLDLLAEAFTHRSYVNEHLEQNLSHNERLEFLGDAVLDFIAGEMLFLRFSARPEGDLTRLRAALVSGKSVAALAKELDLGSALRMGKGENATGGRSRMNNLAGVGEAFIGALYLDQGIDALRDFIVPYLSRLLDAVLEAASDKDARSLLQEWSQATKGLTPEYNVVNSEGPDHEKQFTIEVSINGEVIGRGVGLSKQEASQMAAKDALAKIKDA